MAQAFNLTAQINLRGPSNIGAIVSDIRNRIGSINASVNLNISPAATTNITRLNAALNNLNTTFGTTTTSANRAAAAINNFGNSINSIQIRNLPQQINNTNAALAAINNNGTAAARTLAGATSQMEDFGRQSALAVRRFAAFSVVTGAIYSLSNAINQGIKSYIDYNKELVRLQQVTGESANGLKALENQISGLATSFGVSSTELTNISLTLAQAGLSARDTEKALKALALSSLAPSFDSMNATVEGSIALMRQFGISAGDLEKALGSINAVAAKFAVEASDIITAIQRTGGVFATASRGVSEGTDALNEFIAVFTSVRATTRESSETIATGLRTIFTRIQRGQTIEALKEYGVNLQDLDGKFVGAYKAVELLSKGLNKIDPRELKFSKIVEELGGFRQIGKVIPLIQQFGTAQDALKTAQAGQTSLSKDAAIAQLSLANQIAKVREQFLALFREIGASNSFQSMIKGALSLASAMIKIADSMKEVLPVLSVILAFRGANALVQYGTGFAGAIRGAAAGRRATGGAIGYNSGGTVNALLTPGEAVIEPQLAKKIGRSNLDRMNHADKIIKRNKGGGVRFVPGVGDGDTFGPIPLEEGSYVIRKKAVEAIGGPEGMMKAVGYKYGGDVKIKKAKKPTGLPSAGPTEFTHIHTSINSIPRKLAELAAKTGLGDITRLYTNMGLDLPKTWNRNWAITQKDNYGAFTSMLSSFISQNDVFKTLKSSGKIYRFTGRSKSPASEILRDNDIEIRRKLSNKLRGNKFFDTDPDVSVVMPNLLKQSVDEVLNSDAIKAQQLMKGFQEISVYKTQGDPGRKKINQEMRSVLPRVTSVQRKNMFGYSVGGFIEKFMSGSFVSNPGRAKVARILGIRAGTDDYSLLGKKENNLNEAEKIKKQQLISDYNQKITTAITEKEEALAAAPSFGLAGLRGKARRESGVTTKGMVGTEVTMEKGVMSPSTSRRIEAIIRKEFRATVSKVASIIANQVGTNTVTDRKELNSILQRAGLSNVTGAALEAAIAAAGAPYSGKKKTGDPIDFPQGLGPVASAFGIPSDIPTDVTRTVGGKGKYNSRFLGQVGRYLRKVANGGFIQRFSEGRFANAPLIDDIVGNAPNTMLPIPTGSKLTPAIQKLIEAGGGAIDYDGTIEKHVGDEAFARARTDAEREAVLEKYYRGNANRRLGARPTKFAKDLQKAIKDGLLKPTNLTVISKSKRLPVVEDQISSMLGIPRANMIFTQGGSKIAALEAFRTKGPRVNRVSRASGGEIPIMAQEGEYVIQRSAAQRIGYNNLDKLNKYHSGGAVRRFARGGSTTGFDPATTAFGAGNMLIPENVVEGLNELSAALNNLGVTTSRTNDLLRRGGQVTYQAVAQAYEMDLRRLRLVGSIEQIVSAEQNLLNIRRQSADQARTRQNIANVVDVRGTNAGQVQQNILDRARIDEERQLRRAGGRVTDPATLARIKEQSFVNATQQVTGRRVAGASGGDIQQYIQQSMLDRRTLAQMDAQYVNNRSQQIRNLLRSGNLEVETANRINNSRRGVAAEIERIAREEVAARRRALNEIARSQGIAGPGAGGLLGAVQNTGERALGSRTGGFLSRVGGGLSGNAGFFLPMAAASLGTLSGPISRSLSGDKATQAKYGAQIESGTSTLGVGLGIAGGLAQTGNPYAVAAAGVIALGTGAYALIDTFADLSGAGKKAAQEIQQAERTKLIEKNAEEVAIALKTLEGDVKNIKLRENFERTVKDQASLAERDSGIKFNETLERDRSTRYKNIFGKEENKGYGNLLTRGVLSVAGALTNTSFAATQNTSQQIREAAIASAGSQATKTAADSANRALENRILSGGKLSELGTKDQQGNFTNAAFTDLVRSISLADEGFYIMERSLKGMDPALQEATRATYFRAQGEKVLAGLLPIEKTRALNEAMELANRAGRKLADSLEKLGDSIGQAVNATLFFSNQLQSGRQNRTARLSGESRPLEVQNKNVNILQNPLAYSREEFSAAVNSSTSLLGNTKNAQLARGSLEIGRNLSVDVEKAIADSLAPGKDLAKNQESETLAQTSIKAGKDYIKSLNLGADVEAQYQDTYTKKIKALQQRIESEKQKNPELDTAEAFRQGVQEVAKDMSSFGKEIIALEQQYTSAVNEFINIYADASKRLKEAREFRFRAESIGVQSFQDIRKASTGVGASLTETQIMRDRRVGRLTGGVLDPAQLANKIMADTAKAEETSKKLEQARINKDEVAIQAHTAALQKTNDQIDDNRKALEDLANNTDVAAAALDNLGNIRQLQLQSVEQTKQKLTASPEENFRKMLAERRLANNLQGGINTNSRESQLAFSESLRQTGDFRQARLAREQVRSQQRQEVQSAFESQRAEAELQMKNQQAAIIMQTRAANGGARNPQAEEEALRRAGRTDAQISGSMNEAQARLLEKFATESGQQNDPNIQRAIGRLRDPNADLAARFAADEAKRASELQQQANMSLAKLSERMANMPEVMAHLDSVLTELSKKLGMAQLNANPTGQEILPPKPLQPGMVPPKPEGIGDLGPGYRYPWQQTQRRAKGGVIYAATGNLINFEPKGSDTVPAMLTPGEFVINARATAQHLPLLKAINSGKGFSKGGVVYLAEGTKEPVAAYGTSREQQARDRELFISTDVDRYSYGDMRPEEARREQAIRNRYTLTSAKGSHSVVGEIIDVDESGKVKIQAIDPRTGKPLTRQDKEGNEVPVIKSINKDNLDKRSQSSVKGFERRRDEKTKAEADKKTKDEYVKTYAEEQGINPVDAERLVRYDASPEGDKSLQQIYGISDEELQREGKSVRDIVLTKSRERALTDRKMAAREQKDQSDLTLAMKDPQLAAYRKSEGIDPSTELSPKQKSDLIIKYRIEQKEQQKEAELLQIQNEYGVSKSQASDLASVDPANRTAKAAELKQKAQDRVDREAREVQVFDETKQRLRAVVSQEEATIATLKKEREQSGWFGSFNRGLTGVDTYEIQIQNAERRLANARLGLDSLSDARKGPGVGRVLGGISSAGTFNKTNYYDNGQVALDTARGLAGLPHVDVGTYAPKDNKPVVNRGLYNPTFDETTSRKSSSSLYRAEEESLSASRDIAIDVVTSVIPGGGVAAVGKQVAMTGVKQATKAAVKKGFKYGALQGAAAGGVRAREEFTSGRATAKQAVANAALETSVGAVAGGVLAGVSTAAGKAVTEAAKKRATDMATKRAIQIRTESRVSFGLQKMQNEAREAAELAAAQAKADKVPLVDPLMASARKVDPDWSREVKKQAAPDKLLQEIEAIQAIQRGQNRGVSALFEPMSTPKTKTTTRKPSVSTTSTTQQARAAATEAAGKAARQTTDQTTTPVFDKPLMDYTKVPTPPDASAAQGVVDRAKQAATAAVNKVKTTAQKATGTGKEAADARTAAAAKDRVLRNKYGENGGQRVTLDPNERLVFADPSQQMIPKTAADKLRETIDDVTTRSRMEGNENPFPRAKAAAAEATATERAQLEAGIQQGRLLRRTPSTVNPEPTRKFGEVSPEVRKKLSQDLADERINEGRIRSQLLAEKEAADRVNKNRKALRTSAMAKPPESPSQKFNKGGIVYANNGALIAAQTKGPDTVPAMLTPGEFVVNRRASQSNLPILQAINSGHFDRGGLVNYLANGGIVAPRYYANAGMVSGGGGVSNGGGALDSIMGQISALKDAFGSIKDVVPSLEGVANSLNTGLQSGAELLTNASNNILSSTSELRNMPTDIRITEQKQVNIAGVSQEWNKYEGDLLSVAGENSSQQLASRADRVSRKSEGQIDIG